MSTAIAIEDRLAIQDLIAAYSWALDTGDTEGLVACFTSDARMVEEVFEDPDIWEGHDGIRGLAKHYFNAPGFPGRQHHVTQRICVGLAPCEQQYGFDRKRPDQPGRAAHTR